MAKKQIKETIHAKGIDIGIYTTDFENEFISLTDIARYKSNDPNDTTDFSVDTSVGGVISNAATSSLGGVSGSLVTVQQMIVRSEDDIRRVSQELYNLIQTGSRAQGRFSTT